MVAAASLLLLAFAGSASGFSPPPRGVLPLSCSRELRGPLAGRLPALGAFGGKGKAVQSSLPDVVIEPDYKLAIGFLGLGAVLDTIPYVQLILGPLVTALGVLFLVQTARIRFVFDGSAFELKTVDSSAGDQAEGLSDSGENFVVGGANRWDYSTFVNWEFFPEGWIDQPQGPILVYFKETQTPKDQWNAGPGAQANSDDAIANGAVPGQVHFFPALCNTKQLREEFKKRSCAKL